MVNFFTGLLVIFLCAFVGYIVKLVIPVLITGTDDASVLFSWSVPIAIFVVSLVLGLFIMIGRRKTTIVRK